VYNFADFDSPVLTVYNQFVSSVKTGAHPCTTKLCVYCMLGLPAHIKLVVKV
jgi:hypothetical protein